MKTCRALCIALLALAPVPAFAGQAEVRDVALANNCPPKKTEVYQQTLGQMGETVYRVECTVPKTVNADAAPPANAVLISCVQNMCSLLQTVSADKK